MKADLTLHVRWFPKAAEEEEAERCALAADAAAAFDARSGPSADSGAAAKAAEDKQVELELRNRLAQVWRPPSLRYLRSPCHAAKLASALPGTPHTKLSAAQSHLSPALDSAWNRRLPRQAQAAQAESFKALARAKAQLTVRGPSSPTSRKG